MEKTKNILRIFGLIFSFALFLALCACSNTDKLISNNTSAPHEEETLVRSILGDFFITDGSFIYFANESNGGRLARVKRDMTEYEILDDAECFSLYLYDNYIYYELMLKDGTTAISKIRVDGEEKQILGKSMFLGGSESYLFFIDDDGLNRMKHDGTDVQMIFTSDVMYYHHIFTDEYIYMSDLSDEPTHGVYRIDTDGKNLKKISDDYASSFNLMNGRLFYGSDKLVSVNLDGSDKKVIPEAVTIEIVLDKDWIYYIQSDYNATDDGYYKSIWKIRSDGTERTILYNHPVLGVAVRNLSIIDDHIFFKEIMHNPIQEAQNPQIFQYYRMKVDGSNLTPVSW